MKRCTCSGLGSQPHEMQQALELHDQHVAGADRVADAVERGDGRRRRARDRRQRTRQSCAPSHDRSASACGRARRARHPARSGPRARLNARLHERQHRRMALGGEVQPRERSGHDFRRGRLEIEEQAQRFGEIDIGEILQDVAVDASVEQPRQDGLAQQALPRARAADRARRARACRTSLATTRGSSAANSVATSLNFRLSASSPLISAGSTSSSVRRRSMPASVDGSCARSARSVSDTCSKRAVGIDPHPALVRWVQVIDRAALTPGHSSRRAR